MTCRYGDVFEERGNYVAALGAFMVVKDEYGIADSPDLLCFFTKEDLEKTELDILDKVKTENKYMGLQQLAQMAIRMGVETQHIPELVYTHEERIELEKNFLGRIKKIPHLVSARTVDSVAKGTDHPMSDVDIRVITNKCPGEGSCEIYNLIEKYLSKPLDVWCLRLDSPEVQP